MAEHFAFDASRMTTQDLEFLIRALQSDRYASEALRLKREIRYESALPLMLRAVEGKENTNEICFWLWELGKLYVQMLRLDEAESVYRRLLTEACRYYDIDLTEFTTEYCAVLSGMKSQKLTYGNYVQLRDLVLKPQLNGQEGVIRGLHPNGRFLVDVNSSVVLVRRENFSHALRVVQLSMTKDFEDVLVIIGTTLAGQRCATVRVEAGRLSAKVLRAEVAKQMGCVLGTLKLVLLPGGEVIEDGTSNDERLLLAADSVGNL